MLIDYQLCRQIKFRLYLKVLEGVWSACAKLSKTQEKNESMY